MNVAHTRRPALHTVVHTRMMHNPTRPHAKRPTTERPLSVMTLSSSRHCLMCHVMCAVSKRRQRATGTRSPFQKVVPQQQSRRSSTSAAAAFTLLSSCSFRRHLRLPPKRQIHPEPKTRGGASTQPPSRPVAMSPHGPSSLVHPLSKVPPRRCRRSGTCAGSARESPPHPLTGRTRPRYRSCSRSCQRAGRGPRAPPSSQ